MYTHSIEHLICFRTIDFYLAYRKKRVSERTSKRDLDFEFQMNASVRGCICFELPLAPYNTHQSLSESRSCDLQETFHILPCTSTKSSVISLIQTHKLARVHTQAIFSKKQLKMRENRLEKIKINR